MKTRKVAGEYLTPYQAWEMYVGSQSIKDFIGEDMEHRDIALSNYVDEAENTAHLSDVSKDELYELLSDHMERGLFKLESKAAGNP